MQNDGDRHINGGRIFDLKYIYGEIYSTSRACALQNLRGELVENGRGCKADSGCPTSRYTVKEEGAEQSLLRHQNRSFTPATEGRLKIL